MSEHEAPTIARATLWLDTSNETVTRSAGCLDDCATRTFERPAERGSAGTTAGQPAETAVLDRAQLIAAIDRHQTEAFQPEHAPGRGLRALAPAWKSVATHALALVVGGALSAALLRAQSSRPVLANAKPRVEQRAQQNVPAAPSPTKTQSGPEGRAPSMAAVQASLSDAVDALARGDYEAARTHYEALARQHPNDAALSAVASILVARSRDRCTAQERNDGSCAR
jgi:hypothetical protein